MAVGKVRQIRGASSVGEIALKKREEERRQCRRKEQRGKAVMVGRRKERQRKLGRNSEGKKQRQLQSVCEGGGRCAPGGARKSGRCSHAAKVSGEILAAQFVGCKQSVRPC
eukprot:1341711-Rhodomonas_salina.1